MHQRSRPAPARGAAASGVPGRGRVTEIQRARVLAAMAELVRERGFSGVTVAHVVARSGVSRRTFYEQFEDREGCLLAAFEHGIDRAAAVVVPAYRTPGAAWEERVRAALGALLELFDAQPALGGLCVVDVLAGDRRVLQRRARVTAALVDAVHRGGSTSERAGVSGAGAAPGEAASASANGGRAGRSPGRAGVSPARPARVVAEGVVGAVLAVIYARMLEADDRRPLGALLNQLTAMIVLPYLGAEAAARELRRPAPRARRAPATAADPLRELDMRLTYRTVRVLFAIAELGRRDSEGERGPSNRAVADAAGISDPGQISKLLRRLTDLGLVANSTPARIMGTPNAWVLTARGREVERAIRAQTA